MSQSNVDAVQQSRRELDALLERHPTPCAGEKWFVIDAAWWNRVIDCKQGAEPGPINNEKLQGECPLLLRTDIMEERDFKLVHQEVWKFLHSQYGGGPSFGRTVVTHGAQKLPSVDLYPLLLRLVLVDSASGEPDPSQHYQTQKFFHRREALSSVLNAARRHFDGMHAGPSEAEAGSTEGKARIWIPLQEEELEQEEATESQRWVDCSDSDLKNCIDIFQFKPDTEILLEWCRPDGTWPRESHARDWRRFRVGDTIDALDTHGKWYESTVRDVKDGQIFVHYNNWDPKWDEWIPISCESRLAKKGTHTNGPYINRRRSQPPSGPFGSTAGYALGTPPERGAVGLRNLGNTCFMNSTLQALSNTPWLTDFFVDDEYLTQINRSNPLGWQGRVAESYGNLIKALWSGEYKVVSPRELKYVIGEFQPRFRGYQQQDSSELLNFLLDGLHEDLNRVKSKPATAVVESGGRPDSVVSSEAWSTHLKRNQSIIVDLLQGQVKSTLVCPQCSNVCITFDPFMTLSLSLPVSDERRLPFTLLFIDRNRAPLKLVATVKTTDTIADFKRIVSELASVPAGQLLAADIWNHRLYGRHKDTDAVDVIRDTDNTWFYEVAAASATSSTVGPAVAGGRAMSEGAEGAVPAAPTGPVSPLSIPVSPTAPRSMAGPYGPRRTLLAPVLQQLETSGDGQFNEPKLEGFGVPFFVRLPRGDSVPYRLVFDTIRAAAARFVEAQEQDDALSKLVNGLSIRVASSRGNPGVSCRGGGGEGLITLEEDDGDSHTLVLNDQTTFYLVWNRDQAQTFRHSFIQCDEVPPSAGGAGSKEASANIALEDCLKTFTEPEVLGENDAWYCPKCKAFQCARKQMQLWKLPDILIVHLKRFSYSQMWREKIQSFVDFPIEGLDLSQWTPNPDAQERIYDLYAVSNHYGSLGGGHYTAYCRNLINGAWYNHDDASVSPVQEQGDVKSAAAYVLFYRVRRP